MGSKIAVSLTIAAFVVFLMFLAAFGGLIGYMITAADAIALIMLAVSLILARNEIKLALSKKVDRYSFALLCLVLIFFVSFSFFLPRTELIFFDENIYQGVALNILHSGNALMCEYGTRYVQKCLVGQLGFDPGGWPLLIAVAFRLFGTSNATTYNLELLMGALSIIAVFLISSILTERRELAVLSTAVFALIPELYIWSKTLANPDMPFMAFATITTLLFLIFLRKTNRKTLLPFAFCLVFTIYLRVQALLLVPLFLLLFLTLSNNTIKETFRTRAKLLFATLFSDSGLIPILAVFLILIVPQLYTMLATAGELKANAAFYLYPNTPTFSASYILPTLSANTSFLLGLLRNYPIVFLPNITALAIIGTAFLVLQKKRKNRFGLLLLLLGMTLVYFIFFLFYFSGSVLVGVSVRYLLILYPPLSILAAFGLVGLGDWLVGLLHIHGNPGPKGRPGIRNYILYIVLLLLFFVVPFAYAAQILVHPTYSYFGFPLNNVTSKIQGLNPYTTQYAKNSYDFVESNYELVPKSCLVLSEVPSLWFMLNRSSSYLPETDIFTNSTFSNYSCYYLDYGFWCGVSPYNTTVCKFYTTNYRLRLVATEASGGASNFSLYQILNYTNSSS